MRVVPELGGDEDVLALESGDFLEGLLDTFTDLRLVAIDLGKIQVTVTSLEGFVDGSAGLTGRSLPGAKTQSRDLVARVKSDGSSGRHADGGFRGKFVRIGCRWEER